jgi:hypothetical protein
MKLRTAFFLATIFASSLPISAPLLAHHGSSAYEPKLTTLKGTVSDYQFMNPHTELSFDVKDSSGKVQHWTAEASSALTMSRLGWSPTLFKAGDQLTVSGNRAKNGTNTMRLRKVTLANGKEYQMDRGEDNADQ